MSAHLCVNIYSNARLNLDRQEIEFYNANEWSVETEEILFNRMRESVSSLRTLGICLDVTLNVEVKDIYTASFIINKKIKNGYEIKSHKLSIREIEVLSLIMLGHTTQEIADKFFISYETVKSHRKNILEKTGAKNTAALINYYHQTFSDK